MNNKDVRLLDNCPECDGTIYLLSEEPLCLIHDSVMCIGCNKSWTVIEFANLMKEMDEELENE